MWSFQWFTHFSMFNIILSLWYYIVGLIVKMPHELGHNCQFAPWICNCINLPPELGKNCQVAPWTCHLVNLPPEHCKIINLPPKLGKNCQFAPHMSILTFFFFQFCDIWHLREGYFGHFMKYIFSKTQIYIKITQKLH